MKTKFKKFREFDEDYYEEERGEKRRRLNEKRMRSAIRTLDLDSLLQIEDEY